MEYIYFYVNMFTFMKLYNEKVENTSCSVLSFYKTVKKRLIFSQTLNLTNVFFYINPNFQ